MEEGTIFQPRGFLTRPASIATTAATTTTTTTNQHDPILRGQDRERDDPAGFSEEELQSCMKNQPPGSPELKVVSFTVRCLRASPGGVRVVRSAAPMGQRVARICNTCFIVVTHTHTHTLTHSHTHTHARTPRVDSMAVSSGRCRRRGPRRCTRWACRPSTGRCCPSRTRATRLRRTRTTTTVRRSGASMRRASCSRPIPRSPPWSSSRFRARAVTTTPPRLSSADCAVRLVCVCVGFAYVCVCVCVVGGGSL